MAALFSSVTVAADCTVLGIVGKISKIERDENTSGTYVIRAACPPNERIETYAYQWLYGNDRIEITDGTKVIVSLAKGEQRTCTRNTNCELPQSSIKKTVFDIRFPLIERPRKLIPVFNVVRSIRSASLENDPLLPSGTQYLPYGYEQVTLLWKGGPSKVNLSTSNTDFSSENKAFITIPIPQDRPGINIYLSDPRINWHIQNSATVPVPEGMEEPDPASLSDRLIRALWIMENGLDEWRLFALSELEILSHTGLFAAEEFWHATLSGDLVDILHTNK